MKLSFAYPVQKFQDWLTQQWVILTGKKINIESNDWLKGPHGVLGSSGEDFILQLAKRERLTVERNDSSVGILSSISDLNLSDTALGALSEKVIDFYENTAQFDLNLLVHWNPFFKIFGWIVNHMFSKRINQLNVPFQSTKNNREIQSKIITLNDITSGKTVYTFWLRSFSSTGQIIYSGLYSTCTPPSGKTCVKAVFPLPKGNATVILSPSVNKKGELKLTSSGNQFGDAGFYFLLEDAATQHWARYIRSFRDQLIVSEKHNKLIAKQSLTLWNLPVLTFTYEITKKTTPKILAD